MTEINGDFSFPKYGNMQKSTGKTSSKPTNAEIIEAMKHLTKKPKTEDSDNQKEIKISNDLKNNILSMLKKQYHLGDRIGNVRYIDVDSVMEGKTTKTVKIGNATINIPTQQNNQLSDTTDGYISDSNQAQRGDCFFLAELNAIRNTKEGQQLLKNNCKQNKDGSYTITLPGAKAMREAYAQKGLKCEITGTYTISKAALDKAGASNKYSRGDLEVIAFELAMEAYRAELIKTNKANGNKKDSIYNAEGNVSHLNNSDMLNAGFTWDAGFILTGKKSEVYINKQKPSLYYQSGKYGYISREEMARRTGADISMYQDKGIKRAGTSEISHFSNNSNDMLSKYQGHEGEYALTFSVKVAKNGPDGTTKAGNGHALTVVKITNDTVYVANPWYPDKIEPIPRKDFIKMTTAIQAMPVKANSTKIDPSMITEILQRLNNK